MVNETLQEHIALYTNTHTIRKIHTQESKTNRQNNLKHTKKSNELKKTAWDEGSFVNFKRASG